MKTVKQKMFALTENVMANSWSRFQIKGRGSRCYSSLDISMPTNDPPQEKHNQLSTWETHYYKSCFLSHTYTHTHTHAYKGEESWCHVVGEWVMKTGFLLDQQHDSNRCSNQNSDCCPCRQKESLLKKLCVCVCVHNVCKMHMSSESQMLPPFFCVYSHTEILPASIICWWINTEIYFQWIKSHFVKISPT